MKIRRAMIIALALAAVVLGWVLYQDRRSGERVPAEAPALLGEADTGRDAPTASSVREDARDDGAASSAVGVAHSIDVQERARFNEQAREFFAQAAGLPPEEVRQRAVELSQDLSRIEQAGGMSAGETFLIRAGLIRATVADEQQQLAQIRELKARYEADARRRSVQSIEQSDPMFQLYKVREGQIVAEVMAMQAIPDGLSSDEYLRRRLQAEREQLLGEAM
jgi:uncharacterized protein YoaH (UPF0181 family)